MATHSPQVFRPRPLDIDTPMLVVIQNDPDDEEELKTEKKFKKRDKIIPIPIPVYKEVENYEKENAVWQRPAGYVIYHEKTSVELEEIVEYEMDSEDERFVHTINVANNKANANANPTTKHTRSSAPPSKRPPLLSDDALEKMIDVLEKEAFKKIHQIPGRSFLDYLGNGNKKKSGTKPVISAVIKDIEVTPPPDDVPCVVCNDEDWDEGNMIVFCDGCDLAVHQTCYGVPKIPRADWYCRRCERLGRNTRAQKPDEDEDEDGDEDEDEKMEEEASSSEDSPKKTKGDIERERHNKYRIKDTEEDEDKDNEEEFKCVLCGHLGGAVKPTSDGKWAHVLCALWLPDAAFMDATIMEPIDTSGISKDRTREGCCIQCRTRYCYTAFHPFCAAKEGLLMEMRPAKGRPNNLLFKTHCEVHSKEIRAERGLDSKDKYADIMNQVCSEEIKVGLHQLVGVPLAVADAVCNFWLAKRQKSKHKDRPLISRLIMDEESIRHALKKKRAQRTIQTGEEYTRLRELRRQMDRALIILDVLKKREMYKRDHTRKLEEILETLVRGNEYNFTGHEGASTTPPKKSSTTSTTSSTPPSSSTTTSPLKKTPTKSTQLTLDKFFSSSAKKGSTENGTPGSSTSPSKQRKLRDRSTINPAPLPYAILPTTRTTPIRRPAPPSPQTSSSDESLSLPHTTRKSSDHTRTPDTVRRGTPDRPSLRSRRSKSPAARRSLSPDLAEADSDAEEEAEEAADSDHSSDSSESGMVPKSRAHLRRNSAKDKEKDKDKDKPAAATPKKRKRKA